MMSQRWSASRALLTGLWIPARFRHVNNQRPNRGRLAVRLHWLGLISVTLAACLPASAQLAPSEPDPLTRIRDAAKSNVVACSATGETLCEQVAPKIIANAQGDSPIADNVRQIAEQLRRAAMEIRNGSGGTLAETVAWTSTAFRTAGLDPRVEENAFPAAGNDGYPGMQQAVVAEFRGREKPEEWVLLGARLDPRDLELVKTACNVALVIEAARDIQRAAVHPRRSIRFVIFADARSDLPGSWPYVEAHRDELDRARAAIFFHMGCGRTNGFDLSGRRDIDSGLREAIKPIESWGIPSDVEGASILDGDFDFLLEGVPTIMANQHRVPSQGEVSVLPDSSEKLDVQQLKRSTAIAAVTAFGIAERPEPLGPRQSRAEVELLLKSTIIADQMKTTGIWPLWELGQRGRKP